MNKKLDWIKKDFPEVFTQQEGYDDHIIEVSCHYKINEKEGFKEPCIHILNTLNALTKEFALYIEHTSNEDHSAHDLPWWYNEAPLTGFVLAALVRQFDAIILQDFETDKGKRPDLWALFGDKSILFETKMGRDIKLAKGQYLETSKNTYKMAINQIKGYSKDSIASADYWCVLYFVAHEFKELPDKQEIINVNIGFSKWENFNKEGLPFHCKFIIDTPKTAQCKYKNNKGKYYPLCHLWKNIGVID
jgi:hypothetical protein